jgi:hypothetical protein
MRALPTLADSAEPAYIDQTIAKHNRRPGALLGILEAVQEHHRHNNLAIGKSVCQVSEHSSQAHTWGRAC